MRASFYQSQCGPFFWVEPQSQACCIELHAEVAKDWTAGQERVEERTEAVEGTVREADIAVEEVFVAVVGKTVVEDVVVDTEE